MTVQAGIEGGNTQGQSGNAVQDNLSQQQQQTQEPQQTQQNNGPSPYASHLEKLPESVRPLVEPIFKDWDAGVNQRFQQLHSQYAQQYAWAQPYQEIAQQGYDIDSVSQGLQLLQAINENPQGLYEAIGNAYGLTAQQAQQVVEQGLTDPDGQQQQQQQLPPQFQQLEQTVNTLADIMLQERQSQQEAQEEQAFYSMLDGLKQQHGEFDQDYVVAKIATGMDPQQAVLQYRQLVQGQAQQLNSPGQEAPTVMGSGGGQPTTTVPITQLDKKGRQNLVASLLEANNRQQG